MYNLGENTAKMILAKVINYKYKSTCEGGFPQQKWPRGSNKTEGLYS